MITLISTEWQRTAATDLLRERYRGEFNVEVSPAADQIIVLQGDLVLATAGMEIPENGALPIEAFFDIADRRFREVSKAYAVELTRWASSTTRAGELAVYGITAHALQKQKTHGILSMKEKQIRLLRILQAPFEILDAEIKPDIPEKLRPYYCTHPLPQILFVDIAEFQKSFLSALSFFSSKEHAVQLRI